MKKKLFLDIKYKKEGGKSKMAQEVEGESTEWVIMSDLVQCKLCCKALTNPRVLSNCKHVFCCDCLWHWWQESADSDMTSVICPTCRAHCGLPTEGVSALQADFKSSRQGELLKQCVVVVNREEPDTCSASATGPATSTPPCDVCSMDADRDADANTPPSVALRYCEDCQNHLCETCSRKHAGTSVFARHKVRDLGKVKGSMEVLCAKHPGKPLKYFCSSCPAVSCSVCVTTQHSQGHSVCEITEMVESKRGDIVRLLEEVRAMSQGLDNRDAITEELVMRTKDAFWTVAKQVSDHADQCRKEIEEAETHLLKEIESRKSVAIQRTREEGKKRNYSIIDLETLQSYGNRLLTSATPLEFISNCGELEDRMKTVLQFRDKITAMKIKGLGVKFIPQQGLLSLGRLEDVVPTTMKPRPGQMSEERDDVVVVKVLHAKPESPPKKEKLQQLAIEGKQSDHGNMQVVLNPTVSHMLEAEASRRNTSHMSEIDNSSKRNTSYCTTPDEQSQRNENFNERRDTDDRSSKRNSSGYSTSKARSSSSSLEGVEQRLMPHSGRPRHRPHTRSHGTEKRSNSQASRRNSAHNDRGRRYSGAFDLQDERLTRNPRQSTLALSTNNLRAFQEEEGRTSKLLWEARTMDLVEGETSQPRDVGFLPNGEVYVLNDHFHNLVHFSADGKRSREVSSDFSSPMCLIMTPDGQPAVTDSQEHSIKLFSLDGASYSVWKLDNIMPSGVAIARDGRWIVLDQIDDCFGVFSEPGSSCARRVSLGKHLLYTERYMACDSLGRIFVSGSEDTAVAVFDSDGKHLQDMGGAGSKGGYVSVPRGLYVDQRDNLVVADRHNHRVSMFSPDGRFIRHLVTCPFDKVVWPTGIDFTSGGSASGHCRMALTVSDNVVQVYDVTDMM